MSYPSHLCSFDPDTNLPVAPKPGDACVVVPPSPSPAHAPYKPCVPRFRRRGGYHSWYTPPSYTTSCYRQPQTMCDTGVAFYFCETGKDMKDYVFDLAKFQRSCCWTVKLVCELKNIHTIHDLVRYLGHMDIIALPCVSGLDWMTHPSIQRYTHTYPVHMLRIVGLGPYSGELLLRR